MFHLLEIPRGFRLEPFGFVVGIGIPFHGVVLGDARQSKHVLLVCKTQFWNVTLR